MQNERENLYQPLTSADYDISGNVFRAYYDADGKIVFVLDFTQTPVKPNVLLVINPVGERKWDDILANDYGVDLETVRPKQDNKYQKLDIEYAGLVQYDDLIQANEANADLVAPLQHLEGFRNNAARRAAQERLGAAELTADKARDTIDRTNETISYLQGRLKQFRGKLAMQRREIGREPTKQSAAKILRTETQIDAAMGKLARAKKRLQRAQRRLDVALEEIDVANNILTILGAEDVALPVAQPKELEHVVPVDEKIPEGIVFAPQINIINNNDKLEPKAENMADEEVKPLFDTDPKILDEQIAFKPVEFNAMPTQPGAPVASTADSDDDLLPMPAPGMAMEPVSFAPVVESVSEEVSGHDSAVQDVTDVASVSFQPPVIEPVQPQNVAPMLDSITSVSEPVSQIDPELMPSIAPIEIPQVPRETETVASQSYEPRVDYQMSDVYTADTPVAQPLDDTKPVPLDDIEPAPLNTGMRPVSPIVGDNGGGMPPAPVSDATVVPRKPTMLYYVLLILLIVLSIFTLWFYQNATSKATPELGVKTQQEETVVVGGPVTETQDVQDVALEEEPQIQEVVIEEVEPATVAEPVSVDSVEPEVMDVVPVVITDVVPEPVPVVEPEPVQLEVAIEPEPVPVTKMIEEAVADSVVPEPTIDTIEPVSPFLDEGEVQPAKKIITEEEILARKPVYGVSQNEQMFVADDEYETDLPAVIEEPSEILEEDMGVDMTMDTQIVRPDAVEQQGIEPATHQYVTQQVFEETEEVETCADGNAPDADGCCAGEELAVVDGEYMCCAIGTDDCFPPMN